MQRISGVVTYLDYNTKSQARRPDNRYEFSHTKQRIKITLKSNDSSQEHHLLTHFYLPVQYADTLSIEITPSDVPGITGECVKHTHVITLPEHDMSTLGQSLYFYLKYHVYGNGPDADKAATQYKAVILAKAEKEWLILKKTALGSMARSPYDVICLWSEWYVRGNPNLKAAVPTILTKEREADFFWTWYQKQTIRRLRIFGIAEADFRNHWFGDCRLYYEIMKNPYAVPTLSYEQRETVFRHHPELRNSDSNSGETIQHLFNDVKSGHSATPVDKFKKIDQGAMREYGVRIENNCAYLDYPREAEAAIAAHLDGVRNISVSTAVLQLAHQLDPDQALAVEAALSSSLTLITGGAGRGKSRALIQLILELTSRQGCPDWVVAFPTGKSMMVILDQLPPEVDLDRFGTLAKWIWRQKDQMRIRLAPRVVKHLIVDESSMVSSRMLHELLQYYPEVEKLTLFGDEKQLQPVEWGRPFKQLIEVSGLSKSDITCVDLKTNHRCSGLGIVRNADAVAMLPNPLTDVGFIELSPGDGFVIQVGDKDKVVDQYFSLLPKHQVLGLQVISPLNRDVSGLDQEDLRQEVVGLNTLIRERMHLAPHPRVNYDSKSWMIGDKVMVTQNVYVPGCKVFNGQMGVVVGLIKEGSIVKKSGKSIRGVFMCLTKRGWTDTVQTEDILLALEHAAPSTQKSTTDISGLYVAIPGPDGWRHREFYVDSLATVHAKGNTVYWTTELGEHADRVEHVPVGDPEDAVVEKEVVPVLSIALLQHAYCITVHKSQGSEWDAVITFIRPCGKDGFIGKNIVYTALTRAKKLAVLVTPNKHYVDERCREVPEVKCEHLVQYLS